MVEWYLDTENICNMRKFGFILDDFDNKYDRLYVVYQSSTRGSLNKFKSTKNCCSFLKGAMVDYVECTLKGAKRGRLDRFIISKMPKKVGELRVGGNNLPLTVDRVYVVSNDKGYLKYLFRGGFYLRSFCVSKNGKCYEVQDWYRGPEGNGLWSTRKVDRR